jgi:hypothetical protein
MHPTPKQKKIFVKSMEEKDSDEQPADLANPRNSIHEVFRQIEIKIKPHRTVATLVQTSKSIGAINIGNEVLRLKIWYSILESVASSPTCTCPSEECMVKMVRGFAEVEGIKYLFGLFCEGIDAELMAVTLRCAVAYLCLKECRNKCVAKKKIDSEAVSIESCQNCDPKDIEDFVLPAGKKVVLPSSVIQTCFEILIGKLRASDASTELEIFSQEISNVWMIRIIMKALPQSSEDAYKLAISNLSSLVAANPINLKKISTTAKWTEWLVPMLSASSAAVEDQDLESRRIVQSLSFGLTSPEHVQDVKLEVYILCAVITELFKTEKKDKFLDSIRTTIQRLPDVNNSFDHPRLLLFCVLNSVKEFIKKTVAEDLVDWLENTLSLVEISEEFVLFKSFSNSDKFSRSIQCSWNKHFGLTDTILVERVLDLLSGPLLKIEHLVEHSTQIDKKLLKHRKRINEEVAFWSKLGSILNHIQTMTFLEEQDDFASRVDALGEEIEERCAKRMSLLKKLRVSKKSIRIQILELAVRTANSQLLQLIRPMAFLDKRSEEKLEAVEVITKNLPQLQTEIEFDQGERKFRLLEQFQEKNLFRKLEEQKDQSTGFEFEADAAHSLKRGKFLLDKAKAARLYVKTKSGSDTSASSESPQLGSEDLHV